MGATLGLMDKLNRMRSPELAIHPERCATVRNRNANCNLCAEACAGRAIAVEDGAIAVDPDRCVGCGSCAAACPTGALEAMNPSPAELGAHLAALLEHASDGRVTVACHRAVRTAISDDGAQSAPAGFVEVVCLGRIDESVYLELAARGASGVTVACADCDACPLKRGTEQHARMLAEAQALLDAVGAHLDVTLARGLACGDNRQENPRDAPAYRLPTHAGETRAERGLVENAEGCGGEAVSLRVPRGGTLPQHVPERHRRVFNCLRAVGTAPKGVHLATRLWGSAVLDREACISCRRCAVFCPTGALRAYDDENAPAGATRGLEFSSALCVQCRTCEYTCPRDALCIEPDVDLAQVLAARVRRIPLKPPAWEANRPDSLFKKWSGLLGEKNLAQY